MWLRMSGPPGLPAMKTLFAARPVIALAFALHLPAIQAASDSAAASSAMDIFQQRIMPIFKSPDPSSCVQCHLSAVDLKDYILPSSEQTFASLRAQGLIDVDNPEKSKILELISMGEKDVDKGAKLIHEKMRKAEYEAFAAWITAGSKDPTLRKLSAPESAKAGPNRPDEVIRHARKNRVLDSFVRNVWSQRMRCFPCHTPHEIKKDDPNYEKTMDHLKGMEDNLGITFSGRLNLFLETPEETMDHLLRDSREPRPGRLPLVNLRDPDKSLFIIKPTSKIPPKNAAGEREPTSFVEPVTHLGGLKMHPDDFTYKAFLAWIQDYSSVVGDRYVSADELPADNWYFSQIALVVKDAPEKWPLTAKVQLAVYAWDSDQSNWLPEPVAFTQGLVGPNRNVFGKLFLLRSEQTEKQVEWTSDDPVLAPGKYLVKAYVDSHGVLEKDPTAMLGEQDYQGQAVLQAKWGKTIPTADKLDGTMLK